MSVSAFLNDLRHGARAWRRTPLLAAIVVFTFALGLGASTAVFSLVNATLLRPLSYPEPDRLMMVWETHPKRGWFTFTASYPNFFDWSQAVQSFERIGGFTQRTVTLTGIGEPQQMTGSAVTASVFPMLGVQPLFGRLFTPEEDRPGSDRVTILSYELWQETFSGDPGIVGRAITLNGVIFTVIGVMPRGFEFPPRFRLEDYQVPKVRLWATLAPMLENPNARGSHFLFVMGRLRPGVTVQQSHQEMEAIAARLARTYPRNNAGWSARVEPLDDYYAGDLRTMLLVLLGAVVCLTLIGCANIASLILAHSLRYQKDTAIRVAMGCSRPRLIFHVMGGALVLSLLGAVIGLFGAVVGLRLLVYLGTTDARLLDVPLDARVLAFTLLMSVVAAVTAALMPALRTTRRNIVDMLKVSGPGAIGTGRRSIDAAAVVLETALAVILLTGAGLMLRSVVKLQQVDIGFDPARTLSAEVTLPAARYTSGEQRVVFFERLLERVRALPRVESAAAASEVPLGGSSTKLSFNIFGRAPVENEVRSAGVRLVTPGYFETTKIAVVEGRTFTPQHQAAGVPVVIINEAFARRFWPKGGAVGQRMIVGFPNEVGRNGTPPVIREIVGVVAATRSERLDAEAVPEMFVPYAQHPSPALVLVVRSGMPVTELTAQLRAAVREGDPNLALYDVKTFGQRVTEASSTRRFGTFLLNAFAVIACVMAVLGIYGIVSESVARRRQEIGIRMVLGASSGGVLRMMMRFGFGLACLGLAIGIGGAFYLTRYLRALLFGITPTDTGTFVAVAATFLGAAMIAAVVPACRAVRGNPMSVVRSQ